MYRKLKRCFVVAFIVGIGLKSFVFSSSIEFHLSLLFHRWIENVVYGRDRMNVFLGG